MGRPDRKKARRRDDAEDEPTGPDAAATPSSAEETAPADEAPTAEGEEAKEAAADQAYVDEQDLLEGFGEPEEEGGHSIDHRLRAHVPGRRAKDERWYEVVERELSALPKAAGHDRRTFHEVFDKKTMMTLYKFLSTGVLKSLDYPVSTGKEANVFAALTPEETPVCVKIFRTNTATFHDVLQYIQGDPRFVGIKKEKRGLVAAWAQKEYRNLGRSIDHGVRVPEPIACLDNVLLMEYIGDAQGPAPRMKDVTVDDPEAVATAILDDYHRMLVDAHLVHADLSEFNILWQDGAHVIIDVGQAVLLEHPMAAEFFDRDVRNLARFLARLGADVDEARVRRHVLGPDHAQFEDLL